MFFKPYPFFSDVTKNVHKDSTAKAANTNANAKMVQSKSVYCLVIFR